MFTKLIQLFYRYPNEVGIKPVTFLPLIDENFIQVKRRVLAFQLVTDKCYFLLFGAIAAVVQRSGVVRSDLIIIRDTSGAIGWGFLAKIKRSPVFAWLFCRPWINAYSCLNISIAYRAANCGLQLSSLSNWIEADTIWRSLKNSEKFSLNISGIDFSDLLIDEYLRYRPSPSFNISDYFVRYLIWRLLCSVDQSMQYFSSAKPTWYLTSYTTYIEHGVPARVALSLGVEVWTFGSLNHFGKRLTLEDTFSAPDFSSYRRNFEFLDGKEEKIREAEKGLLQRLSGNIDGATSYMKNSAYRNADIEIKEKVNGAVVIFLHDFYDSPHIYSELIFNDFWEWVCFTIEALKKHKINFFIKPHPNQIASSEEALDLLRTKYPDIKWLSTNISNVELAKSGIVCGVTVFGTIIHELAFLGVPSIACSQHPHHVFDFCKTAKSKEEYEDFLKECNTESLTITKDQMRYQSLVFYYMHNLQGESDDLALRKLWTKFWKNSSIGCESEKEMLDSFYRLVRNPAFEKKFLNLFQIKIS